MEIEEINDQYAQAEIEEQRLFRSVELVELAEASRGWSKQDIEDLKALLGIEDYFRSAS